MRKVENPRPLLALVCGACSRCFSPVASRLLLRASLPLSSRVVALLSLFVPSFRLSNSVQRRAAYAVDDRRSAGLLASRGLLETYRLLH